MDSHIFTLIITLLLAHLIGDFLLQPTWLARKKKRSIWWMFLHSLINAMVTYVLLGRGTLWLIPLVVFVSHFLIDLGRSRLKKDSLVFFLLDQTLHLAMMGALIGFYLVPLGITSYWFEVFPKTGQTLAIHLSALILLTRAGGVLIGLFVKPFQEQIRDYDRKKGLDDGGKVIGWLERLLIYVFVLEGQYAGVGFLIAAKSIFRFGELKESENRKEAEYIIIGTFASFFFAIVVSLLAKWASRL